jgi:hypothetical protein
MLLGLVLVSTGRMQKTGILRQFRGCVPLPA